MPKWMKIGLYVLALFAFQEAALRFVFPLPEFSNLDRSMYLGNGEKFLRNQTWTWESRLDTDAVFVHEMNRYGFRDGEWSEAKAAGTQRVLFIGDSFVEGVMAEQGQSIPEGFKAAAGPDVEVMNAGLLGQGMTSYLQLMSDMLPIYKPDVVFMCLYANDLGKNLPAIPEFYLEPERYNFWKPRLLELIHQAGGKGAVLPRWGGYTHSFMPIVPNARNPWTDHAAELRPHVTARAAEMMEKGTYNPFRTNALAKEAHFLAQPPNLGELLPYFSYICKEFRARPVLVYLPSRNQVTRHYLPFERETCQLQCPDSLDLTGPSYRLHQRVLAEQSRQFGVPFIDMTDWVAGQEAQGRHLFWNYDEHMRGWAYLQLGKALAERWMSLR